MQNFLGLSLPNFRKRDALEFVLVCILTTLAVITIAENASRETLMSSISARIAKADRELAATAQPLPPSISEEALETRRQNLLTLKTNLSKLEDHLSTLINIGTDSDSIILKRLIYEFGIVDRVNKIVVHGIKNDSNYLKDLSESYVIAFIYQMRSDHLLALSLICCSTLGVVIVTLRSEAQLSTRTITSGVMTGFLTYLALKGGQVLFVLHPADIRVPANPFSCAFVAILTGMFSDKVYKFLSKLVDRATADID